MCVLANKELWGGGLKSSWTKVRWPISHPADACSSDPQRQVGDTNWQSALAELAQATVGEGMKVGTAEGESERVVVTVVSINWHCKLSKHAR